MYPNRRPGRKSGPAPASARPSFRTVPTSPVPKYRPTIGHVRIFAHGAGYSVLVREPRFEHAWLKLPGGKIEEGETPLEAAQRELKQETGIELPLFAFRLLLRRQRHWSDKDHGHCLVEACVPKRLIKPLIGNTIICVHEDEKLEVTARREIDINWERELLQEHNDMLQEFWK